MSTIANPCLLQKGPIATRFKGSPGKLNLTLIVTHGVVTFDPVNTSVTDSKGNKPSDYQCSNNQLTFTLVTETTYTVKMRFVFGDPANDTGEVKDSCTPAVLDHIVNLNYMPTYTIVVS
jgi:hypothetical protein